MLYCPGRSSVHPTVLRGLRFPSVQGLVGYCIALNALSKKEYCLKGSRLIYHILYEDGIHMFLEILIKMTIKQETKIMHIYSLINDSIGHEGQ